MAVKHSLITTFSHHISATDLTNSAVTAQLLYFPRHLGGPGEEQIQAVVTIFSHYISVRVCGVKHRQCYATGSYAVNNT